jgi:non-ribosomal peptide synthetase component F
VQDSKFKLHNYYGPCEATIAVTVADVPAGSSAPPFLVGKPMPVRLRPPFPGVRCTGVAQLVLTACLLARARCHDQNVQIFILDPYMNLCPIGVAGEIFIGGVHLTHGYLDRPDLTKAAFISNHPLCAITTHKGPGKLYKSGDVGRYLPDGTLE